LILANANSVAVPVLGTHQRLYLKEEAQTCPGKNDFVRPSCKISEDLMQKMPNEDIGLLRHVHSIHLPIAKLWTYYVYCI
jgi:hypothetical protein